MAHLALTRAITRAHAKNVALRNVSALTGNPGGHSAACRSSDSSAALRALHEETAAEPGDFVFCTAGEQPLDAANVRRSFRTVCQAAGIGPDWARRELRHTFVSPMSDSDVAVEEIARLVGHASSKVTDLIYRYQLRPVMTKGRR